MRKSISILFLLILPGIHTLIAQIKHDYVWILGYPPNKPEKYFGGVELDFNRDIVSPEYFDIYYGAEEPSVLSSPSGSLMLYTNGCSIITRNHHAMQGGDTISAGYIWDSYCGKGLGYPGDQNNLILPLPGDTTKAVAFYKLTTEDHAHNILLYAEVDFGAEHADGEVIHKDEYLVDPGSSALLTATKHGNGRDWWLILPEDATNRFFILLLDPHGVSVVDTQAIGHPWEEREWASQAVFTPDGTKYIRFNPWKGLDIFDFDRCSGQLSNPIESGRLSDPVLVGGGAAASVDSRFLYVSNVKYLYQFDLTSSDIFDSRILIDTFDGYFNPFQTNFYQMTLAPDGKIYMFSSNGVKSIHVINHPERLGKACGFVQHGMELPAFAKIGSPNIPYFRLGPMDGSTCDSLGLNNSPIADFRYEVDSLSPYLVRFKDLSYFLPETWDWDFDHGLTSDLKDPPEVDFEGPGSFPVCLTVSNPYGQHTFCRTVVLADTVTSVGFNRNGNTIRFYPNPAGDFLYADNSSANNGQVLSFYSVVGTVMFSSALPAGFSQIDISNWSSGIYFYTVQREGIVTGVGKVLKQ